MVWNGRKGRKEGKDGRKGGMEGKEQICQSANIPICSFAHWYIRSLPLKEVK
jgi:hypothetical protein